ncbi:D-3-phosphoglycerate dehydrogenase [Halobellus sp. Atlit-31R]|nr:D-3-phosphoglycerate dehydrogenase [Halobellus sp. Atlit-31R]
MIEAAIDQDLQPVDRVQSRLPADVTLEVGLPGEESELIEALQGKSVLFTTSRLKLTRRVFEETALDVVGKVGTGIDSVDLEGAADNGVAVTYTPGINALSVAEHALGLALATLRHTSTCQEMLRDGGWRDVTPEGTQLSGRTVGIVGFGNIGRRFAGLLRGFNVEILAYDPYVQPEDTELVGATLASLEELFSRADLVSVHAELTGETRGMVGSDAFELMSSDAVLVNTARGPVVDEAALVAALQDGSISGAGLDVFESEPLSPDSPLYDLRNVTLTPHVAARTTAASNGCIDRLTENVQRLLTGGSVPERYLAVPQSVARK